MGGKREVPEEELSAEVALLDVVHVSQEERTLAFLASADSHQSEVLQELATQRTGANQEHIQVPQLLLEALAEHGDLAIIPCVYVVKMRKIRS